MKIKKIAVIFGGFSSEYPVSLQSAHAVISNMDSSKYEPVLIGITKDGSWYRYYGDIENIKNDSWHTNANKCISVIISPDRKHKGIIEFLNNEVKCTEVDAVFPILHGKYGEDGTLQGLVELAGIPLIGCKTLSSSLCMDKYRAHRIVSKEGIEIPKSIILGKMPEEKYLHKRVSHLNYPLFVKPVKAGSSFGITKVMEESNLFDALKEAFNHDDYVIIEENIKGFEVGCAVLGNDELIVSNPDEIELSKGFFDYEEKYTLKHTKIHMPARVDKSVTEKIKKAAEIIYRALDCKGFARIDMFLTPDNNIVFNEVNTIPGFTEHSRYPNMLKGIGMSYSQVVDKLIELGLE